MPLAKGLIRVMQTSITLSHTTPARLSTLCWCLNMLTCHQHLLFLYAFIC